MKDSTFSRNCLIICKSYFFEYDDGMRFLNELEQYVDNAWKRAFLEGAKDYLAFVNDIDYVPRDRYILNSYTFCPDYILSVPERLHIYRNSMPTWLYYNVVTEGCNSVC